MSLWLWRQELYRRGARDCVDEGVVRSEMMGRPSAVGAKLGCIRELTRTRTHGDGADEAFTGGPLLIARPSLCEMGHSNGRS